MKKFFVLLFVAALALAMTGCGSLRTPGDGPRKGNTYYQTFFGISIESAVYGDGIIVKP